MKLRRTKQSVPVFWPLCITLLSDNSAPDAAEECDGPQCQKLRINLIQPAQTAALKVLSDILLGKFAMSCFL